MRSSLKILQVTALAAVFVAGCNFNHPKAQSGQTDSNANASPSTYSKLQSALLNAECASCHNPGRSAAGVDVTSFAKVAKGKNDEGQALVVPGNKEGSLLYTVIRDGIMPPSGPVSTELLTLLGCWIDQGALEAGDNCQSAALGNTVGGEGNAAPEEKPSNSVTPPEVDVTPDPGTSPVIGGGGVAGPSNPGETPSTPVTPPVTTPENPPVVTPENPPVVTPEVPPTSPETPIVTLTPSFPLVMEKIITASCVRCHSDRRPSAGVNLSTYAKIAAGKLNDGTPLLAPGNPEGSALYTVIRDVAMPPSGVAVEQNLQELLKCWIAAGGSETTGDQCQTLTR